MITSVFIGFQALYATLVCVACSQLEKLRANLLRIGEGRVRTKQDSDDIMETVPGSEEIQKQLIDCIRHHQTIQLYVHNDQSYS
jgi:hypothetical protein